MLTVEDTFAIRGRGVVVVPGVLLLAGEVFRVGDPLELRRPDGTVRRTSIAGLEIFTGSAHRGDFPLLLPQDITKEDVPAGTEVWSG